MFILKKILQVLFFLFFLFFTQLLLKLDPFLFSIPSGIIILLTVIFGRVFCGFICPLGSLIEFIDFVLKPIRRFAIKFPESLFGLKSLLFILVIGGIIFKIPWLSFLDPLVIFSSLANALMSLQNIRIEYIFVLIVFSLLKTRFWCRYICPLGALLSLVTRFSCLTRVTTKCTGCSLCVADCPAGSISITDPAIYKKQRCILCLKCMKNCLHKTVSFKFIIPLMQLKFDYSKREMLIGSISLFSALFVSKYFIGLYDFIRVGIRPPGSLIEPDFIKYCIRCGLCIKVCPTKGLHTLKLNSGLLNYGTPVLIPQKGYCEYTCKKCLEICPTGALQNLSLQEKQRFVIGKAEINRNLCLPYSRNINCLVCEENCPVLPQKAIQVRVLQHLKVPYIIKELCIGCGTCEYVCRSGPPAITITPV